MRKFLTLFAAFAVVTMAWANESGKLTSSVTPIDPSQTVTLTYDGTGTNFANWEPSCFIHAWLVAADGKTFSKSYSTDWAGCNGDEDYALLDDKVKMTFVSKGKYTIDINIQSFFDVAEEDLPNIGKLGVIVRAQYPGENNQTEDMLLDVAVKGDDPEPPIPVENVTLFFVNVPAWEAVHAYVWPAEGAAYKDWPGEAMGLLEEQINEKDVYSYTFPGSYANIIFNNGDKGKQTEDLTWDAAKPYFYDGEWYAKEDIPAGGETPEPPVELIYSIKNNWNGGVWAWKIMSKSPAGEGLYEFAGYFGGTGVNITNWVEGVEPLWFDLENIIAKEAIEAGDSVLFIFDAKEVTVTAILVEHPEVPVVKTGYALLVNDIDTIALTHTEPFGDYDQWFVEDAKLKAGDVVKVYNYETEVAWAIGILNEASSKHVTNSEAGLVFDKDGEYTMYLKLLFGLDEIYVAPLPDEGDTPEPPAVVSYYIKNNWNGGEWAWRLMVESPTAEGLYEFSGYFGGTGVNIISSEEGAEELWFDLENIIAKEAIEAGDSVLFIFDAKEVTVTAILVERPEPVVTPKFYITGNEALLGENAWNPEKAIEVMEESYTFKALAAGKYELLVLLEKNWDSKRGYSDLTVKPEGVTTNDDNNIIFTLAEEGDVTVVLTSERFAIDGNFSVDTPEPPVVKTGYALLVNDIDTIALTHTEPFGDYDQWFVEDAKLKAGDVVKVYNYETEVAWAIGILNEASSKHVKNSEAGLVFDQEGAYTFYLKLLFGLDEIYVAPLPDEGDTPEPPAVVSYYIKNNWNGGEWAWRLMVESPTAEGLYEFSGYFGGTGVNIISSEEGAEELWFDLENIIAKEAIEAGDSVLFIFDAKEVTVTAILVERPEVPVVKTGYALLVNDIDTIALTHTEPFGDYDQWFVEGAKLKANDVVKVYNYESEVAWAIGILNEASSKHVKNSEAGLVFDKDGEYTMYLKLLFGLDEIYVAPLPDEGDTPEPPAVVSYYIKNNWNGGEWAWRLMVESPTAEGLYEFSGYIGGTGVNIISSEEGAEEMWFDLENIIAKEAIEAGDSVLFIFDAKEVTVTAILVERPEVPVVKTGYALLVNDIDTIALTHTEPFGDYDQWFVEDAKLKAGDVVKVYNYETEVAWAIGILNEASSKHVTNSEAGLVFDKDGEYTMYLKLLFGLDEIYVAPLPDEGDTPEPPAVVSYYIKNNWNGGEWAWRLMVESPTAEGLYEFSGFFGGTGVNIISSEEGAEEMWFDLENIIAKEAIEAGDSVLFIFDAKEVIVTAILVERPEPVVTPDFYIIGSSELMGAWDLAKAIPVEGTTHTFEALPAGMYSMKVLLNNDNWSTAMGFNALTGEIPAGVTEGEQQNIVFTLDEPSDVTVTFKADEAGIVEFTVAGNFSTAIPVDFYITGNAALMGEEAAWTPEKAIHSESEVYTFKALAPGEYSLKVLTSNDGWSGAKGYTNLTFKPEGVTSDRDDNINFVLDKTGDVTITFKNGGEVFTIEGDFYVEPAPIVVMINIQLIIQIGQWPEGGIPQPKAVPARNKALAAADFKVAAWTWIEGDDASGKWSEFFTETEDFHFNGDVPETATHVIFVKFPKDALAPTWEGITDAEKIYAGEIKPTHVFVVGEKSADWEENEYGILIGDATFVKAAYNEAQTEWKEFFIADQELLKGQTFVLYDNTVKAGWVVDKWSEGSYVFSIADEKYAVSEDGLYSIYIKMLGFGNDELYVSRKDLPSDIDNVEGALELRKVLENGTLYIYRDGKKYSVQGYLVR